MSSFMRAFDAVSGWVLGGSSYIESLVKISGLSAGFLVVLASPSIYGDMQKARDVQKAYTELSGRAAIVFNSAADCVDKGFGRVACEQSRRNAVEIATNLTTTIRYRNYDECVPRHHDCATESGSVFIGAGAMPESKEIPGAYYHPPMVAWQALKHDITRSVPLYAGPSGGTAVRADGKKFTLG